MKIALGQVNSTVDFESNYKIAMNLIDEAILNKADLVAFPENFLFLGDKEKTLENVHSIPGEVTSNFQKKAAENQIALLLGSIYELNKNDPKKVFNTSLLIGKSGEILAQYRKIHLFDVSLKNVKLFESENVSAGSKLAVTQYQGIGIGLSICYDLRFPHLYQTLTQKGAQVIFVPSAFTVPTGKAHWENLLQTRAIENQVYIAAPAQQGRHSDTRESFGHTLFIDPWGEIKSVLPEGIGLIYGEVDLEFLNKIRKRMPIQDQWVRGIDY